MKSQKYRMNNDKLWKLLGERKYKFEPFQFEKKGQRYGYRYLDSGYFENQTWGALRKAWIGYSIANNKFELDKRIYYARIIRKLQRELGIEVSNFDCLDLDD
jgi:hypothetical protein